ncbi:MAG: beta-lactamase family protein [Acidimicrobiia bacterium]|nr:beta-lactamase family protein [Acidimicrobiia bacterium]
MQHVHRRDRWWNEHDERAEAILIMFGEDASVVGVHRFTGKEAIVVDKRTNRRKRVRRTFVFFLVVLLAGLAVLHVFFPLSYVFTVLKYRGPDFTDIHRFESRTIAASASPSEWDVSIEPRIATIAETHPDLDDFDVFLDETETSAFLVVHDGRLVEERYLLGHGRESLQNSFSISKSIMSAAVGVAIDRGAFRRDAPITEHLPELGRRDERFARITVAHLLDMQSGIRYSSEISFPIINCDDPLIYYHPDLESVVLERTEIESAPGTFEYNNYNPALIGLILRRATGAPVGSYLEREIWQELGAAAAGWTVDDRGFERMESGFHARGRDLARFGLLYLEAGRVAGRQVVPEEWVTASTTLADAVELDRYNGRAWVYNAGWWIVPRPEGRPDFCAIGRFGQFIYVSPQHEAVFVRTGPGRGDWGDYDWTAFFYFVAERL